jgi:nucleoside-diphosphate-sugar epimerase
MGLERIAGIEELEERLSQPTPGAVQALGSLAGDIIVLGAGGKMGPSLARMAKRASEEAGVKRRVIAVSRFTNPGIVSGLQAAGVEPISCDLLDENQVTSLPDSPNVIYMAGTKFGTTGNEPQTWAMNAYLPGIACRRYRGSRIVAFSSGNIYGLVPVASGGSKETDEPQPVGEYAWSVLGRERVFQYFCGACGNPGVLIRLNYACELRYGVVVDIAQRLYSGRPVSLAIGYFNTIWQQDANAMVLQSLSHAEVPVRILNLTGPETLRVREVAERLGKLMGKRVSFEAEESSTALLNDSGIAHRLFGPPRVGVEVLMEWVADWVVRGGDTLGKPTHFESRDGRF